MTSVREVFPTMGMPAKFSEEILAHFTFHDKKEIKSSSYCEKGLKSSLVLFMTFPVAYDPGKDQNSLFPDTIKCISTQSSCQYPCSHNTQEVIVLDGQNFLVCCTTVLPFSDIRAKETCLFVRVSISSLLVFPGLFTDFPTFFKGGNSLYWNFMQIPSEIVFPPRELPELLPPAHFKCWVWHRKHLRKWQKNERHQQLQSEATQFRICYQSLSGPNHTWRYFSPYFSKHKGAVLKNTPAY